MPVSALAVSSRQLLSYSLGNDRQLAKLGSHVMSPWDAKQAQQSEQRAFTRRVGRHFARKHAESEQVILHWPQMCPSTALSFANTSWHPRIAASNPTHPAGSSSDPIHSDPCIQAIRSRTSVAIHIFLNIIQLALFGCLTIHFVVVPPLNSFAQAWETLFLPQFEILLPQSLVNKCITQWCQASRYRKQSALALLYSTCAGMYELMSARN